MTTTIRLQTTLFVAVLAVAVSACATTPTPAASDTPIPPALNRTSTWDPDTFGTYTAQQTSRALSPPPPTFTPRPSATPTPTLTPTVAVPLSAEGPWFVFRAYRKDSGYQLWAVNQDGSGLATLADFGQEPMLDFEIQPVESLSNGLMVAYVTRPDSESRDIKLHILSVPGGEDQIIASLINDKEDHPPIEDYLVRSAIVEGGLTWSPDGQQLAFVGQIDGESVDVYLYDVPTGAITRLSSGSTHAFRLEWSPDGQWIIHEGFAFLGMGGPGMSGLWAARTDGKGSITIYDETIDKTTYLTNPYLGWWSDSQMLVAKRDSTAGSDNYEKELQAIDITTGASEIILTSEFLDAAYSPEHGVWLLSPEITGNANIPVRLFRDGQLIDIAEYMRLYRIWWAQKHGQFFAIQEGGALYGISVDGTITQLAQLTNLITGYPIIHESPDGAYWIWDESDHFNGKFAVSAGPAMSAPTFIAQTTEDWQLGQTFWSPDSQRIFMFGSDGLWIVEPLDFKPVRIIASSAENDWVGCCGVWLPKGN